MRFLVVDDDESAGQGLVALLTLDGTEVASCTSGADAVSALALERFDVVITDLEMPYVDGRAVACTAREQLPHACVVVCTGRAREQRPKLVAAGACFVIDKPIDYDGLTSALAHCSKHACHLPVASSRVGVTPAAR